MTSKNLTHTFNPVADAQCKVLILGTFPSVKSRENNFYYGHPQNRFWKVLAQITSEPIPCTIAEKRIFLLKHHIALWDVIQSCTITGSADSTIKNVVPNDISKLIDNTQITTVFTNGAIAKKLYDKYISPNCKLEAIALPSTSPANAIYNMDKLINKWIQIEEHL